MLKAPLAKKKKIFTSQRLVRIPSVTWSEQDDRHGDEGADHQDDQQSDGDPFPVPLRRTHPSQVLRRERTSAQNSGGEKKTKHSVLQDNRNAASSIGVLIQQWLCLVVIPLGPPGVIVSNEASRS